MHAFLQDASEDVPERAVGVGLLLLQLAEGREDLGRDGVLDLADHHVVLQHFARDVERQVGGIDDALDEAQVLRQEHVEVVADEHVAHVERKAALDLRHVKVHAGRLRQEQERLELHLALAGEVDRLLRILVVVREMPVELRVLFALHVLLGALPERRHRVEGLRSALLGGLAVLFLLEGLFGQLLEQDRIGDEVRVGLHQLADAPFVQILLLLRAQVQDDVRAVHRALGRTDRVAARAVGRPFGRRVRAALLRDDGHAVGHHERGVEAYAEASDQLRQVGGVALLLQGLREGLGARRGDHAQIVLQLVRIHAAAVVADGERLGVAVGDDADGPRRIVGDELGLRQALIFGAVDGIGGVGQQLAQEYFLLRIERIDDEIEHLADLCLEQTIFLFHGTISF